MRHYWIFFLITTLMGCSPSEEFRQSDLRKRNQKGEYIYRMHDEYLFTAKPPNEKGRAPYPWETHTANGLPKITKEYFRCRGSSLNPEQIITENGELRRLYDCGGAEKHSLPLKDGKEFIYSVLLEIVNYVQEKTQRRVVITCGHRCQEHNVYADASKGNMYSKHMIGAEVSFYVQGMENRPYEVLQLIQNYYADHPTFKDDAQFNRFHRYEKGETDVTIQPWYNKEIFIKLYMPKEGRDFDNRHPYPYLSVQVRYDRDKNERVVYNWKEAAKNLIRR